MSRNNTQVVSVSRLLQSANARLAAEQADAPQFLPSRASFTLEQLEGRVLYSAAHGADASGDTDVEVLADGGTLVASEFQHGPDAVAHTIVTRFNPDGSLDAMFANDGRLDAGPIDRPDLRVNADGSFVLSGMRTWGQRTVLTRGYSAHGMLDASVVDGGGTAQAPAAGEAVVTEEPKTQHVGHADVQSVTAQAVRHAPAFRAWTNDLLGAAGDDEVLHAA